MKSSGVTRGCGKRKKGGIYIEVPTSPNGRPIEDFLVDPPIRVDKQALGLSNVGVKLLPYGPSDCAHVFDIIGQEHYPNVADFVEEARCLGISRRVPTTLDFSKLHPESMLLTLHGRAWIENRHQYVNAGATWTCPKKQQEHLFPPVHPANPMCAGLWWNDLEPSAKLTTQREMPWGAYAGLPRPAGIEPHYALAIFGSFPLGRIVVINDPDGGTHEAAMNRAKAAKLPCDLEDE